MNEFKVGDWVTTKAGYTKQISGLTRDACDTLSIGNTSVGINVVFKNEIELWQPKEGEWCWFWDTITPHRPTLRQFGKYEEDYFTDTEHNPFTSCEPFFGELPSFLRSTHATN